MSFFFRCDASKTIGSGHVIRCINLAKELSFYGANSYFICRPQPGDLSDLIKQKFSYIPLPPFSINSSTPSVTTDTIYLGCTEEADAHDTLFVLSSLTLPPKIWIIVDHYALGSDWHLLVKNSLITKGISVKFLIIDDLADRKLHADILLNQNLSTSTSSCLLYQNLVPDQCRTFLGPYYSLLAESYRILKPLIPIRKPPLQRILLFFGGYDNYSLTLKTLSVILFPIPLSVKIDVVISSSSPQFNQISNLSKS